MAVCCVLSWLTGVACGTCSASASGDSGIIHSPVCVHFLHCIGLFPLLCISQEMSLIRTLHPALHSFTTDTKEWEAKPGTMWASLALGGSIGSAMFAVWLERMVDPFGSLIWRGSVAIFLSVTGAAESRKWLEAPESKIAHFILSCVLFDTVRSIELAA